MYRRELLYCLLQAFSECPLSEVSLCNYRVVSVMNEMEFGSCQIHGTLMAKTGTHDTG